MDCLSTPSYTVKRKALVDLTNVCSDEDIYLKSDNKYSVQDLLPILEDNVDTNSSKPASIFEDLSSDRFQNVHPLLGWYKHDLNTGVLSYDDFNNLMQPENDVQLINLLSEIGVIADHYKCLLCGGDMNKVKDEGHWFWICRRRVNGVKCQRKKKSIRTGTIFEHSKLSTQDILKIVWHFVHHLSEKQCVDYTKLSSKNNTTVVKWYRFCREICTEWFWKPHNTPKLGGFGHIVEMDESYFPGKPRVRRLGEHSWEDADKWGFGMTQRGSLDAIIEQVPSNRSRATLLPIVDRHCLDGTIFCSDGWKAYNKLRDHLQIEDSLHFSVNHSENFVDPETGAHTQTIEGLWRHCKAFLPSFGLKSRDLHTYLGTFLWHRYCKQRKLDMFVKFLKCAAEIRPPDKNELPNGTITLSL